MSKITSYQKLKARNQDLMNDIRDLVMNKDKEAGITKHIKYKINFQMEDTIWFGNPTKHETL